MASRERNEAADDPRREEERSRVAMAVRGQLVQRGIDVRDEDDADQLVTVLEAVEQFEREVAERGGDSFTNAPDSRRPDEPRFVVPQRGDDETAEQYARRVREAAQAL